MDSSTRLTYLRALGVDVWVRREAGSVDRDARRETRPAHSDAQDVAASDRVPRPASHVPSNAASLDWPELESAVKTCTKCDLHRTRTQTVFGVGDRQAQWMVIGEAPGADEDALGEPFVGRAGQLLNSMLKAVGLAREQVFIANILKCRPPNNRDPSGEEASRCTPYLQRQIELVNPTLLLCVGRIAAQNLLNTDTPIGKLRGKVHRLGEAQRPVVVTYHPAYLLRSPLEKRRAWEDLVLAMRTLDDALAAKAEQLR
jgi:uracil-DNA glycosylase